MYPNVTFPLPEGWHADKSKLVDNDIELTHLEAYLPDDKKQADSILVDIYAGAMPEGSSAEKEAYNSFLEVVGFDDEEDEEQDPLTIWPFQGKDAYGYEGICDDDSIMRVMCVEMLPGILVLMNIVALDEDQFEKAVTYVEANLSVTTA